MKLIFMAKFLVQYLPMQNVELDHCGLGIVWMRKLHSLMMGMLLSKCLVKVITTHQRDITGRMVLYILPATKQKLFSISILHQELMVGSYKIYK